LHTYRGRQGADVGMLVRRLKERSAASGIVCVGTSATMVASRDATTGQRRDTVAEFATKIFGQPINQTQIIEETLEPFTLGGIPSADELRATVLSPLPSRLSLSDFRRHPLARWAEGEFGIEPEQGGLWRRRVPRTLSGAAERLSQDTGVPESVCRERLREVLNRGGELVRDDGGRAFAFKLHQFIGQGRAVTPRLSRPSSGSFPSKARRLLTAKAAGCSCQSSSAGNAARIITTSSEARAAKRFVPIQWVLRCPKTTQKQVT
ncbi:MAG: hypothetical protein ACP5MD_16115, partial [Verrucomicrobiia bacterium]